jgi:glycosyltransferase involved in cell wall biosynthesis
VTILFVTKHLRVGGAQRLWAILLPALRERGLDARLLTLDDEGEFYRQVQADGVPVDCARMRGRLDLPRLLPALRRGPRPDVVVTYDERSHVVGAILARRHGIPSIACDYASPGFPWKPHRRLLLRFAGPRVAAAVTVAAQRNPDLARYGIPKERIRVIPCGVDTTRFRPQRSRDAVRGELGLDADAFVALLPVVLRPEKQPARFVEAVARAHVQDARIHGLVTGYGPLEAEIRAQAAGRPEVSVLGHREDMADLVAASDVICLTSDFEAVPYALLEAMALARPVVAMRAGSLAEVVADGETGRLVAAGDVDALAAELVALAQDPAEAARLGAAGRERQRTRYDAAVMCDAYVRLFDALARSSTLARAGAATATE